MLTKIKALKCCPRLIASLGMATITIVQLTEFMHLDMKYNTLLTFCQISVVPIDAAKIILQAVLSFWIFLGIRTRVVSSFALILVGVEFTLYLVDVDNSIFKGQHHADFLMLDFAVLSTLFVALGFCILKGGGPFALWARGWNGLLPE